MSFSAQIKTNFECLSAIYVTMAVLKGTTIQFIFPDRHDLVKTHHCVMA